MLAHELSLSLGDRLADAMSRKRKAMTSVQDVLWADADRYRQEGRDMQAEADAIGTAIEASADVHTDDEDNPYANWEARKEATQEEADKRFCGKRMCQRADETQHHILVAAHCFNDKTPLESAQAVVHHYMSAYERNESIPSCGEVGDANDALCKAFVKNYEYCQCHKTIEAMVWLLGETALRTLVRQLATEGMPVDDGECHKKWRMMGYTHVTRVDGNHKGSCMLCLFNLAVGLCLGKPKLAEVLIDLATAEGVNDHVFYHLASDDDKGGLCTLVRFCPKLLGRSRALALGVAYRFLVAPPYMHPTKAHVFLERHIKAHPEWFDSPEFVRFLVAYTRRVDALQSLRVLHLLDPAFLHREQVDLSPLIEALKGHKAHIKRVEALAAKIEDPRHRDMVAEHAAAMAVA